MSSESSEKKAGGRKRVSFADQLDVAEAEAEPGSPPLKAQKHVQGENVGPVADTIAERKVTVAEAPSMPQEVKAAKMSRFKAARAVAPENAISDDLPSSQPPQSSLSATPSGPPNATLATTLLERTPSAGTSRAAPPVAPGEDDEDEAVQRKQLAEQYYRQRNQMIREQGGFGMPEGEEAMVEERDDGSVRKVSRFKAARLRPKADTKMAE